MTTHDRDAVIAAIRSATDTWTEDTTFIERFYAIAFENGRVAGVEEAAVIADAWDHDKRIADAIRARGDTK